MEYEDCKFSFKALQGGFVWAMGLLALTKLMNNVHRAVLPIYSAGDFWYMLHKSRSPRAVRGLNPRSIRIKCRSCQSTEGARLRAIWFET